MTNLLMNYSTNLLVEYVRNHPDLSSFSLLTFYDDDEEQTDHQMFHHQMLADVFFWLQTVMKRSSKTR